MTQVCKTNLCNTPMINAHIVIFENWLACTADDKHIIIYEVTNSQMKVQTILRGHYAPITAIDWSPHEPSLLASASADGTVQVWNASDGTAISNFRGHLGKSKCVCWSVLNPNLIYSGGDEDCIKEWNYQQQTNKTPALLSQAQASQTAHEQTNQSKSQEIQKEIRQESEHKAQQMPSKPSKQKEPKSLLKLTNTANKTSLSRMQGFIQLANSSPDFDEHPDLMLFDKDGANCQKLVQMEAQTAKERQDSNETSRLLSLWQGNLVSAIESAASHPSHPNILWLALAPSLGKSVWETMSQIFAKKYEQTGDIHSAVAIYLATHNFLEAIHVLRRANLHKDAIALWRQRVPESDPQEDAHTPNQLTLKQLYMECAQRYADLSIWEEAAKCYITCGEIDKAIKCMEQKISPELDNGTVQQLLEIANKRGMRSRAATMLEHFVIKSLDKISVQKDFNSVSC